MLTKAMFFSSKIALDYNKEGKQNLYLPWCWCRLTANNTTGRDNTYGSALPVNPLALLTWDHSSSNFASHCSSLIILQLTNATNYVRTSFKSCWTVVACGKSSTHTHTRGTVDEGNWIIIYWIPEKCRPLLHPDTTYHAMLVSTQYWSIFWKADLLGLFSMVT